ncbi:hypothetical protein C5L34_002463 [Lentilactobacillus hilgardii]|nr:hypothetical protein C5L34_002463 [Lentilactobacillus hilgardii]
MAILPTKRFNHCSRLEDPFEKIKALDKEQLTVQVDGQYK